MEENLKQLLLKDLCARLSYGVICQYNCVIPVGNRSFDKTNAQDELKGIIPMPDGHIGFMVGIDRIDALEGDIKPYLRPMSSMTEEEKKEIKALGAEFSPFGSIRFRIEEDENDGFEYGYQWLDIFDFLNSYHFDYRGLIEEGLALEAPEEMYKIQ